MKFETPYVEVKKFDVKDILTASGEPEEPTEPSAPACPLNNETPCFDD